MVSIKDVAAAAGVSDKTVSRVVNNEPNVRPETLLRVRAVIDDLNYVPHLGARQVRTKQSGTFGIVTDFISTTPYSGAIVRGIQTWARQNRRTVLLANTDGDPEQERLAWRTFSEHRIDGVLFVTMYHQVISWEPGRSLIPTVLVNCRAQDGSIPAVVPDDFEGSLRLTHLVLDQGHRRLAYIRLNPSLYGGEERLRAFRQATRESGLDEADIDVRVGMLGPVGSEEYFVFRETTELLGKSNRPTAIFCGNDVVALQVYLAVLGAGLRIPEDVSVIGFDDFETVSLRLTPQLTTAALPYYNLGFMAADRLNQMLSGFIPDPVELAIPCPVIVRESTGTVPVDVPAQDER